MDYLEMCDPEAIRLTGLDDAILGTNQNGELVYSFDLMIDSFMEEGMSYEEAVEWIDYNVVPIMGGQGFTILYS
jgi:hypothetical protein